MAETEYLFAVQDDTGREAVSWRGKVATVNDVTARLTPSQAIVRVHHADQVVGAGPTTKSADQLRLLRWRYKADGSIDKTADPVVRPVQAVEA